MPSSPSRSRVVIVSPALADANNGNWQTARRWQNMLSPQYAARIVRQWPDSLVSDQDAVMLALHARRSAASVAAWAAARGASGTPIHGVDGLAVVLTGTDLYHDIVHDEQAGRSLLLARRLVVLQERGPDALPLALQPKTRVIFQSTPARQLLAKSPHFLRAIMVGHLRGEKSPETLFAAARLLADQPSVYIDHIGDPLDPALGEQARATAAACPNYRWLGGLPHEATRRSIQRAHVLIHASHMEGGAHVIMEAVRSGTPVLASRIAGNQGMLGDAYSGYFECGDAATLAGLLRRCCDGQTPSGAPTSLLAELIAQCARRAPLFDPQLERQALLQLVAELLDPGAHQTSPNKNKG